MQKGIATGTALTIGGLLLTITLAILAGFGNVYGKIDENSQRDTQTSSSVATVIQAQKDTEERVIRIEAKVDQLLWDNNHNPQTIIKRAEEISKK